MNPLRHRMGLTPEEFRAIPVEEKKTIPNGKNAVETTTTGHTPPLSPKHSEEAAAKVAVEAIPKQPDEAPKPVSDHQVKPLLAYKDEANKLKSSIKSVAAKIVSIVAYPFLAIGAFFSRLGGGVKAVFIRQDQNGPEPITKVFQQHLADVVVHLTDIKAISHLPSIAKKVIKPVLNNILVDSNVLPKVFNKAKDAIQEKLFAPGKAKVVLDKLEKNIVVKLGEDLAAVRVLAEDLAANRATGGNRIHQNETEAEILKGLANKANEEMSEKEFLVFAKRYTLVSSYQQINKNLDVLNGKLDVFNSDLKYLNFKKEKKLNVTVAEIQKLEAEILNIKKDISVEENKLKDLRSDIKKVVPQLKEKAQDPKTPIFEMQQLRVDIKFFEEYLSGSQPKTNQGVLHKAVYPITKDELNLLTKRYDIIRNYNPKLKDLEKVEAEYYSKIREIKKLKNDLKKLSVGLNEDNIKQAQSKLHEIQKNIKALEEKNPQPILLLNTEKIREKKALIDLEAEKKIAKAMLQKNEKDIDVLKSVITKSEEEIQKLEASLAKLKEEVNVENYSVQAVLERIQKIVPVGIAQTDALNLEIATLKKIIEIENKIYEHEQKYLRDISLRIFNFIYPDELPLKLTLPLRILKLDPKEFILKMLDMILFNAIDGISDPSVIFSLVNDFLKDLKVAEPQISQPRKPGEHEADEKAARALNVTPGLENVVKEIFRIGFPILGSMIDGGFAAGRGYVSVRDFFGNIKKYFSSSKTATSTSSTTTPPLGDNAKDFFVENIMLRFGQHKLNQQKDALAQKLETSGNALLNQGLALADQAMFPDGRLRVFRSGYTNAEMAQLTAELEKNIDEAVKIQDKDPGTLVQLINYKLEGSAGAYIERFNMQAVNKHLIYGMLDQVIAALEV